MKTVCIKALFTATILITAANGCSRVNIYLDTPTDTDLVDHTEERTDSRHIVESSGARGWQYFWEGDYENSLEMFYLTLELVEAQDLSKIADYYKRLSLIHSRLGNNEQSECYLNKALKITQIDADTSTRIRAMRNFVALHASHSDETTADSETTDRNSLLIKQQYEAEQKNEMLAQRNENAQRKWNTIVFLIVTVVLITALLIIAVLFYQNKVREAAITVRHYEELLKLKKEARKQHKEPELEKTDAVEKLASDIQQLFETEKVYRQQGLNVDEIAKRLQTSSRQVSSAINQHYNKNFVEYVNTFRVEEAIEMLKQQGEGGKYAHITIQAIGEEVGFNHKSPFYAAFKRVVGVTPSEYIDNVNAKEKEIEHIESENENTEQ